MLKIEKPRDSDIHTVADFAELLCLATEDRVSSADYLQDFIKDHEGPIYPQEVLDDVFAHMRWRAAAFGQDYPFAVDGARNTMEGVAALNAGQKFYVFMLLAANLPMLERATYKSLTDAFERAALVVLKAMWPSSGVTRPFGKNETDYTGEKWERLNQLSRDIGGRAHLTERAFRAKDSGDGGVDLVSWLALDEFEGENIPSLLAQCACSREEWSKKQTEVSGTMLQHHLVPTHPWIQAIFIPICFRDNFGRWAFTGDVASSVVVDRLRMARFFDSNEQLNDLPLPEIVEGFLDYRMELV